MAGAGSSRTAKSRLRTDRALVSVPEAARLVGVQAQLVHYWAKAGKIAGFQIHGCVFRYVELDEVQHFAAGHKASNGSAATADGASATIGGAWRPST